MIYFDLASQRLVDIGLNSIDHIQSGFHTGVVNISAVNKPRFAIFRYAIVFDSYGRRRGDPRKPSANESGGTQVEVKRG